MGNIVDELIKELSKFFTDGVSIDNHVFKMHRSFTVLLCLIFSVILALEQVSNMSMNLSQVTGYIIYLFLFSTMLNLLYHKIFFLLVCWEGHWMHWKKQQRPSWYGHCQYVLLDTRNLHPLLWPWRSKWHRARPFEREGQLVSSIWQLWSWIYGLLASYILPICSYRSDSASWSFLFPWVNSFESTFN